MTRIGWATLLYTPDRPALVQGQMYPRIARDAKDPLTMTALALQADRSADHVIWISCDICHTAPQLVQAVRDRLAGSLPEVPPDGIILSATHTHCGPVVSAGSYPHPGGDVMTPDETCAWVADHAARVAQAAWAARQPGRITRAFGHAVVGHNRRAQYADGKTIMYGRTDRPDFACVEGYEDHTFDILAFHDAAGALTGLLLAIPCPSQVEEHLTQWSADYWHELRQELRARLGRRLHVLGLCAAAGDISPHHILYKAQELEMLQRRGLTERQEIAQRVADGVTRALTCTAPPQGELTVAHTASRITLPGRSVTSSERDWALEQFQQQQARGSDLSLWWPQRLRQVADNFEQGRPMPDMPMEMHTLRLGDAVLVTNPFELYLDYSLRIKARSPAAQTLVVQLTAGKGGYLPSERAIAGGHYGAHPASAPIGAEGGRLLVEQSLQAIAGLFPATA